MKNGAIILLFFLGGAYALKYNQVNRFVKNLLKIRYKFKNIVDSPVIRKDSAGDGSYKSGRIGHEHNGIDLKVTPGNYIYSPIEGRITRIAKPYDNDNYSGFVIRGLYEFNNLEIKIFYAQVYPYLIGKVVFPGESIGIAEDITQKISDKTGKPYYDQGMHPHIHVEFRGEGQLINPTPFLT